MIQHRVPEVTQVTNRRHPGRQLTPQSLRDDRVQLIVAESRDAIQGTHLAVRNKMNMAVDEPRKNSRSGVLGHLPGLVELSRPSPNCSPVNTREHRMAITSTSYCAGRIRSRPARN